MNIAPLTQAQYDQMRANSLDQATNDVSDRRPVVKLFTPDANCTWLLTEVDTSFVATKGLDEYAREAHIERRIVT